MKTLVIAVLLIALLASWALSTRKQLAAMEGNINNALNQLGVQLSSCFDALSVLLVCARPYANDEVQALMAQVREKQSPVTAASTPEEVRRQEETVAAALAAIAELGRRCPALVADRNYAKCWDAVESFSKMVRTSRLIYNDSVQRFNRAIHRVPYCLLAGLLGFHRRDYLETVEVQTEAI